MAEIVGSSFLQVGGARCLSLWLAVWKNDVLPMLTAPLMRLHTAFAYFLLWTCRVLVNHAKSIVRLLSGVCTAVASHCTPADHQIVEQQQRCSKYSQQAIGFGVSTFSWYVVSEPSSTTRDTAVKVTVAAFFVAITADLISWRMRPRWGRALVYVSSSHLLLMTFLIFVSFDEDYGYALLSVPLLAVAAALLRRSRRQSMDDDEEDAIVVSQEDLDFMFDLSAIILSWDSVITMTIAISAHFTSGPSRYVVAASAAGFFFFHTVLLCIYLMMVATVRTVALTAHAKHLDLLLMVLLVSTLMATAITFMYSLEEATERELTPT